MICFDYAGCWLIDQKFVALQKTALGLLKKCIGLKGFDGVLSADKKGGCTIC